MFKKLKNLALVIFGVVITGFLLFYIKHVQQPVKTDLSEIVTTPESSNTKIIQSHPIISTHDKEVIIKFDSSQTPNPQSPTPVITITGSDFKVKIEGPKGVVPGSTGATPKDSVTPPPLHITIKTNPLILLKPTFAIGLMTLPIPLNRDTLEPLNPFALYLRFSPLIIKQRTQPFVFVSTNGYGVGCGYRLFGNLAFDGLYNLHHQSLYAGLSLKL